MKKINLSLHYKFMNIFTLIFITVISLFTTSCSNSDDLEYEIQVFQQQVDSILVNVVVPKKDSLHAQIENNDELNQESIDLAFKLIPINTAQFLISSQSDTLTNDLELFKSRKIDASALQEQLDYSKFYVDSILIANVVDYQ